MKQRATLKKVLTFITFLICGGGLGFVIGKLLRANTLPQLEVSPIIIIPLAIPIFIIVIAWHEAGHAWAGVKVGFDFRMYIVGPFLWEKQQHQWKFQWNKDINKAGGLVMCLPTDTHNLSQRFMLFVLGGPLASLLLTIICGVVYGFLLNTTSGISTLHIFLILTGVMSFAIFIATIIPSKIGGFYSDGARALRLAKGGDTAKFEILMITTIANTTTGIRPKDLDLGQLQEMNEIAIRLNEPFRVYIHSFLHQAAFDKGELDTAEKHLLDYVNDAQEIPEGLRNMVWLDAAFFYAYARKNLEEANRYWQQFKVVPMIPKAQILATQAAIDYLKEDIPLALNNLEESLKELPNMIDKGGAIALKDRLLTLKAAMEQS